MSELRIIKQHKCFPDTVWIKIKKLPEQPKNPKLTSPAWTSHAETGKTETNRSVKAKRQVHLPGCSYFLNKIESESDIYSGTINEDYYGEAIGYKPK